MAQQRKLEGRYRVAVDLSKLPLAELERLSSGVFSAIEARRREDDSGRVWTIPSIATEIYLET